MNNVFDIVAIIVSILSLAISYYVYKETKANNQNVLSFDKQKELVRRQEKRLDEVISRLNSRSNFIPFFNLDLDNKNIKIEKRRQGTFLILTIKLRNIGKESASNIMLYAYPKVGVLNYYFKDNSVISDKYNIEDYLNKYYAFPKQCITFTLSRKLEDFETFGNISFRIKFKDLIGNTYMQNFNFKFGAVDNSRCEFSRDNYSSQAELIESNLSETASE